VLQLSLTFESNEKIGSHICPLRNLTTILAGRRNNQLGFKERWHQRVYCRNITSRGDNLFKNQENDKFMRNEAIPVLDAL
jgi:hypothetical protein